jgi:hypothetical protein
MTDAPNAATAATDEFAVRVDHLLQVGLDALRKVRALRVGDPAPASPLEAAARFVVIEPA